MAREFSYRSLHGAKRGRRRLLAATLIIVILFLADAVSGGTVRGAVRTAAADVWLGTVRFRTFITESGYFRTHRSLATENAALKEELARYVQEAAGYRVLKQENSELRGMLRLAETERGITAPVVSSFRSSPYGTFLIGAGARDNISPGDLVVTEGGFVIGTVSDVQSGTAAVNGVFSAGNTTDALIGSTPASVEGQGGGNARANVPRGVAIPEGTPVTAGAFGGRAIGIVGKVESSPTSADQTVYISLPVSAASLRYVYITPAHE